ncbi:MAG: hypothetical protein EBX50_14630 [Chitinophagia bacterium]|nr:hypothetical protein [Chitinophagia bacterium]
MAGNSSIQDTDFNYEERGFSFVDLLKELWYKFLYSLQQTKWLLAFFILGALIGVGYAIIKKTTYTARLVFVVEESKTSGGGSLASALAGQVGLDLGSLTGSSGVLAGDNVLELLKSRSLLKKALLTPAQNPQISLADLYAEVYGLRVKWKNDASIGKDIYFTPGKEIETRLQDSLLHSMMERLLEKELSIVKSDKKLGFFQLQATTRNEWFSQQICIRLLKVATEFYIQTKTRRLTANIERLQKRADSLGVVLDNKTFSTAAATQRLLDANPAYAAPQVDAEISTRNKYLQGTVFAEIVKNLEISKTTLIQETPTVQIVDQPEMPLKKNEIKWWMGLLLGGLIGMGGFVGVAMLLGQSFKNNH